MDVEDEVVEPLTVPKDWKEPEYKEEDFKSRLLEESSFSTLFPKYREKYIQQMWPVAEEILKNFVSYLFFNIILF